MNLLDVSEVAALCPGPHSEDGLPPAARTIGPAAATCGVCGTVSQICPHRDCGGRTRAGGLFCRVCTRLLPADWLERSWQQLPEDIAAGEVGGGRTVSRSELLGPEVYLLASDAWAALQLGRRLLLVEPGPSLAPVAALDLDAGEVMIKLRRTWSGPLSWELLTTRRAFPFERREVPPERQKAEPRTWTAGKPTWFPRGHGDLLWASRNLRAFHQPGVGTSVFVEGEAGERQLLAAPELLPHPAWLNDRQFVCAGRFELLVGSTEGDKAPVAVTAGEPLAGHSAIYEPMVDRVYVSGDRTVYWWQPGSKRLVPFISAGGAAVLRSPQGVVILEADRLRIFAHDERMLWDSRLAMPDFALAALPWDHRGDALLLPCAGRGPTTPLLLADLGRPGRLARSELPGQPPAAPRLAPGGIAAVIRDETGGLPALRWIEVAPRADRAG